MPETTNLYKKAKDFAGSWFESSGSRSIGPIDVGLAGKQNLTAGIHPEEDRSAWGHGAKEKRRNGPPFNFQLQRCPRT